MERLADTPTGAAPESPSAQVPAGSGATEGLAAYLSLTAGPKAPAGFVEHALAELAPSIRDGRIDAGVAARARELGLAELARQATAIPRRIARAGRLRLGCARVPGLLSARAGGTISHADIGKLFRHLDACPDCADVAARFDAAEWRLHMLRADGSQARPTERQRGPSATPSSPRAVSTPTPRRATASARRPPDAQPGGMTPGGNGGVVAPDWVRESTAELHVEPAPPGRGGASAAPAASAAPSFAGLPSALGRRAEPAAPGAGAGAGASGLNGGPTVADGGPAAVEDGGPAGVVDGGPAVRVVDGGPPVRVVDGGPATVVDGGPTASVVDGGPTVSVVDGGSAVADGGLATVVDGGPTVSVVDGGSAVADGGPATVEDGEPTVTVADARPEGPVEEVAGSATSSAGGRALPQPDVQPVDAAPVERVGGSGRSRDQIGALSDQDVPSAEAPADLEAAAPTPADTPTVRDRSGTEGASRRVGAELPSSSEAASAASPQDLPVAVGGAWQARVPDEVGPTLDPARREPTADPVSPLPGDVVPPLPGADISPRPRASRHRRAVVLAQRDEDDAAAIPVWPGDVPQLRRPRQPAQQRVRGRPAPAGAGPARARPAPHGRRRARVGAAIVALLLVGGGTAAASGILFPDHHPAAKAGAVIAPISRQVTTVPAAATLVPPPPAAQKVKQKSRTPDVTAKKPVTATVPTTTAAKPVTSRPVKTTTPTVAPTPTPTPTHTPAAEPKATTPKRPVHAVVPVTSTPPSSQNTPAPTTTQTFTVPLPPASGTSTTPGG